LSEVHARVVGELLNLGESCVTFVVSVRFEGKDIGKSDAAVGTGFVVRDGSVVDEFHKVGPAHVEEFSGLSGAEYGRR